MVGCSQGVNALHGLLKQAGEPDSTRNCLGNPDLESGHKRVPEPPQRMTGVMGVFILGYGASDNISLCSIVLR